MVAEGRQCTYRPTITPNKTCSANIYRRINRRVGRSLSNLGSKLYIYKLVFSKYPFWWDRVGINFSGRVPGYSRRWAIIGDTTKIYTFTNLKHTQIMGSNHLLYFSSTTFFAFKTVVRHRRNVNQEKISVHSKHGCVHKGGVT